jgi:competence protein ComGC
MNLKKTLGQFVIFLVIIGGIGFLLFRLIDSADKQKNESAVIGTIKTIIVVQNNVDCFSLKELLDKEMIDPKLSDGKKAGYIFTDKKSGSKCEITAIPESSSKGNRSFYSTNEDGWKIHASDKIEIVADKNSHELETRQNY